MVWLFLAAVVVVEGSSMPRSKEGWFLLIAFGPPAYVLLSVTSESAMDWLYSTRLFRAVDRHPSSFVRIGGTVLFFLISSLLILGAMYGALRLYYWQASRG